MEAVSGEVVEAAREVPVTGAARAQGGGRPSPTSTRRMAGGRRARLCPQIHNYLHIFTSRNIKTIIRRNRLYVFSECLEVDPAVFV
jgi:hypothetical protein